MRFGITSSDNALMVNALRDKASGNRMGVTGLPTTNSIVIQLLADAARADAIADAIEGERIYLMIEEEWQHT